MKKLVLSAAIAMSTTVVVPAQQPPSRPMSPRGSTEAHVGYEISKTGTRTSIKGGHWIEITYGRPLKRGRELWVGETFGKDLYAGAPVWRAGANVSTRLKTEVALEIGGKPIPGAGEYSMFIEFMSPTDWTLIISSYGAKATGNDKTPDTLWGAYEYKPDKDMVRVPMTVAKLPLRIEQLTWAFTDMTSEGGKITLMWDDVAASVPFKVSRRTP